MKECYGKIKYVEIWEREGKEGCKMQERNGKFKKLIGL